MLVIVINGSNRSGKDRFADYFINHYKYSSINISTIDDVKNIAKKYFDWDGKKNEKSRWFLANMKKLWTEYNNGPFLKTIKKIEKYYNKLMDEDKKYFVAFIHCREPEEIQKFKDKYKENCITILLKRELRTDNYKIAENHADLNVDNYNYDFIIDNNGDKKKLELESIKFIDVVKNKLNFAN